MPRLFAVVFLLLSTTHCIRSVDSIGATEGGFITGTVVARGRQSGILEEVTGARVAVVGTSLTVTTDSAGKFELRRLPLGVYDLKIEVRARGAVSELARRIGGVRIEVDGQSVDLGAVRLGGLADVQGVIALADVNAAGAAEGTSVVLAASSFAGVVGRDDRYVIGGIPPGPYEVAAFRAGYAPARIEGADVGVGLQVDLRKLVLQPIDPDTVYEVAGRVFVAEDEDEDVECAFISETSGAAEPDPIVARSDAEGRFRLEVAPGVYRARFAKPGHRTAELRNVVVTPTGVLGLRPIVLGAIAEGDYDADGLPDDVDDDDDDDGCPDADDELDTDAERCFDFDMDGVVDEDDPDDDGDTVADVEELSEGRDRFITNPFDDNTDDDAFLDGEDNCPLLAATSTVPFPDADGDGVGDPCDDDFTSVLPGANPAVVAFMPTTQGRGLPVTVTGSDLHGVVGVSFEGGAFARATNVAASGGAFDVRVPAEAVDGQLTVHFIQEVSLVAPGTLTIPPGPVVTSISTGLVARGDDATLLGSDLDQLTEVWIGGERAPISMTTFSSATVVVPDAVGDGPQVVEYGAPGRVVAPGVVTVSSDPFIAAITPNPAPVGSTLTLFGRGFTSSGSDTVTIDFDGVAVPALEPKSANVLEVIVPAGVSGAVPVTVTRGGRTSPPTFLTIDADAVVVTGLGFGAVFEGDPLQIIGANLDAPPNFVLQSVTIGGQTAMVTASSASTIDVIVPTNPMSAVVEVAVNANGTPVVFSYPRGPTILRETGTTADLPCGHGVGDVIVTTPAAGMLRTWEYPFANPSAAYPVTTTGFSCPFLDVAPSEAVGVTATTRELRVVQIPTMAPVIPTAVPCPYRAWTLDGAFDSASQFAYYPAFNTQGNNEARIIRMNLTTGACDLLPGTLPAVMTSLAMRPGRNDRELVATGSSRTLVIDVVTGGLLGDAPVGNQPILVDPGNTRDVWTDGARYLRTPGTTPILATRTENVDFRGYVQSANLRYLVTRFDFFDMLTRRTSDPANPSFGIDTSSHSAFTFRSPAGKTVFMVRGGTTTRLWEVLQAAPM